MAPAPEIMDAEALFHTYQGRIYRYILRLVRNQAEAEDLTQETFLRAYRGRDSLRHPDAVCGWLYRIATHICLDRLRQGARNVSLEDEEGVARVRPLVSGAPSLLELAERKETAACVQHCLDFLPDSYRAVLLLHEAHSLTAAEIAELLGLPLSTVKMRLHRARYKLRRVMQYGCAVSNDGCGFPVCQPKRKVD